jgi:hypothetical protein
MPVEFCRVMKNIWEYLIQGQDIILLNNYIKLNIMIMSSSQIIINIIYKKIKNIMIWKLRNQGEKNII